jgi:hypothetical protein
MTRNAFPLLLALLPVASLACNPWANLPNQSEFWLDEPTWSTDLVAAADGLYIPLDHAGQLVRVTSDGSFAPVDLDSASPKSLHLSPDDATLLAFAEWPVCTDENSDIETVSDCPKDKLEWRTELDIVNDGEVQSGLGEEVPSFYNSVAFSPVGLDGSADPIAAAFLDYQGEDIDVNGVLNLTEVLFVDLATGEKTYVPVGISANNVVFTSDGSRAVILSRNHVVVEDLTTSPISQVVSYPLTLDNDQQVDPSGIEITPDGRYLLISIAGSQEIYALDLVVEAENMIDLDWTPSAMAIDSSVNSTVVVSKWVAEAGIIYNADSEDGDPVQHAAFDMKTITLEEPCSAIAETDEGFDVLYNDVSSTHDVYKLDLSTNELSEYVVANPVRKLVLTPDKAWAVAVGQPENGGGGSGVDSLYDQSWTLSLIDLTSDDVVDLLLEAEPVGLAVSEAKDTSYALLLMDGVESLLVVDVRAGTATSVDLPAPPTSIGSLPDGTFYITHDAPLGMVSFLDPTNPEVLTAASGFAVSGFFTDDTLPRTE